MQTFDLFTQLNDYKKSPWNHKDALRKEFKQLLLNDNSFYRNCFIPGHFTASSFVFDFHMGEALLIHHKKLNRWLQPGGHADGDANLLNVAQRELQEECGVSYLSLAWNGIFDLDKHLIPARKSEPEHFHFDVRFVWSAHKSSLKLKMCENEINQIEWIGLDKAKTFFIDASVERLFEKSLALRNYRKDSRLAVAEHINTNI
jgi:8-oxo-dGTP pyrophosphatase MutT (NUDIX family)